MDTGYATLQHNVSMSQNIVQYFGAPLALRSTENVNGTAFCLRHSVEILVHLGRFLPNYKRLYVFYGMNDKGS